MSGRRNLVIGLAIALIAYVSWQIYRAGLGETPPPPSSTDITFRSGVANGERIKTRSWSARYDRIVSNADQTVLELDNVRDGTIYKHGKAYLHVRAAHMTVDTLTRDFSVRGGLHVETAGERPARSFDTKAAQWSDAQQQLKLPSHVVIHSGSAPPLEVGSITIDVRTGQIEARNIAGPIPIK